MLIVFGTMILLAYYYISRYTYYQQQISPFEANDQGNHRARHARHVAETPRGKASINLSINPLTNAMNQRTINTSIGTSTEMVLLPTDRTAGTIQYFPRRSIDRVVALLRLANSYPLYTRFSYPPSCRSLRREHPSRRRKWWREPFPLSLARSSGNTQPRRAPLLA
jgi:hypothetical protein